MTIPPRYENRPAHYQLTTAGAAQGQNLQQFSPHLKIGIKGENTRPEAAVTSWWPESGN
jgi:hypothetical protein